MRQLPQNMSCCWMVIEGGMTTSALSCALLNIYTIELVGVASQGQTNRSLCVRCRESRIPSLRLDCDLNSKHGEVTGCGLLCVVPPGGAIRRFQCGHADQHTLYNLSRVSPTCSDVKYCTPLRKLFHMRFVALQRFEKWNETSEHIIYIVVFGKHL